ncbi:hypothetical protein JVU11DRAFT_5920 [Chiua virens]|nr:hypothetical protein JVU11DRAFT_5920 [Chiua virens]
MLLPLGPTSYPSKSLLNASVILLVCTTAAQSAVINPERVRAAVDISKELESRLSKRIDVPEDKRSSVAHISERDTLESDMAWGWFRAAKLSERDPDTEDRDLGKRTKPNEDLEGWFRVTKISERETD